MTSWLALAAAGVVAGVASRRRGPPPRLALAVLRAGDARSGRARPPGARARHRRVLGLAGAALLALLVWPPALLAVAGWWCAAPRLRRARERRRQQAGVVAGLPDVLDLASLALGAGLTVPHAVRGLALVASPPYGPALAEAVRRADRGQRLADALEVVTEHLGEPVQPLVAALVATERYGVAIGPTLERLALEARQERRRQADIAARKLPVRLSFPLVCCILPAFGLLTLAPLLAGALGSLQL